MYTSVWTCVYFISKHFECQCAYYGRFHAQWKNKYKIQLLTSIVDFIIHEGSPNAE